MVASWPNNNRFTAQLSAENIMDDLLVGCSWCFKSSFFFWMDTFLLLINNLYTNMCARIESVHHFCYHISSWNPFLNSKSLSIIISCRLCWIDSAAYLISNLLCMCVCVWACARAMAGQNLMNKWCEVSNLNELELLLLVLSLAQLVLAWYGMAWHGVAWRGVYFSICWWWWCYNNNCGHCRKCLCLVVTAFPMTAITNITESNLWNAHQTAWITIWTIFACSVVWI